MEAKIKVEGVEYKVSDEGFYPVIIFKRMTGKSQPNVEDVEDNLTLIYSYFKAYNPTTFKYELEDFLKVCNIDIVNSFTEFLNPSGEDVDVDEKKK